MSTTLFDDFVKTSDPHVFILEDTLETSGEAILSLIKTRFPNIEHVDSLTERTLREGALCIFDPTLKFLASGKTKELLKTCIKYILAKQVMIILLHTDMLSQEELLDFRYVIGSWITVLKCNRFHVCFKRGNKHRIQNLKLVENAGILTLMLDVDDKNVTNPLNELMEQSTFNMKLTREQVRQRQDVELPHLSAQTTPSNVPYVYDSEGEDSHDEG